MSTPKPLTVQGIAGLLRRAKFERSNRHRKDVSRHEATTGFAVWATASRFAPSGLVVAVGHVDSWQTGNFVPDDEARKVWATHVKNAQDMLARYGEAISAAGYHVQRRFAAEDPYIIVTAKED